MIPVPELGLEMERPYSRPKLFENGRELRRDRWGNYVLPGPDGQPRIVDVGYDVASFGPVVKVDGRRISVFAPLPRWVRVAVFALVVATFVLAGGFGGFVFVSALARARLLVNRPDRRPVHVVLAVVLPVVALALGFAVNMAFRELTR